MKILVITEEDQFYLPLAVENLIKARRNDIVSVVCARNPLPFGKLKALKTFGIAPIITHAQRLLKAKIMNNAPFLNKTERFFSIKQVCQHYKVEYSCADNINHPDFIQYYKDIGVDLIASVSPTQIFKEELINLPRFGCINIHTAKLPEYRGLYPTYWAMSNGEKTLGISIHYIEKGIDTGKIILQDEIDIPPETTLDHMLITSKLRGAELLVEAIGKIDSGNQEAFYAEGEGSYFSFPTPQSYQDFRKHGYKLW